jgi:hypothetical protein
LDYEFLRKFTLEDTRRAFEPHGLPFSILFKRNFISSPNPVSPTFLSPTHAKPQKKPLPSDTLKSHNCLRLLAAKHLPYHTLGFIGCGD